MKPLSLNERTKAFHAHLDRCEWCREHPFDLCAIGKTLFLGTALKEIPPMHLNTDVTM